MIVHNRVKDDCVKVQVMKCEGTGNDVYYNTIYVVLCLFLDNSDSPSIVEQ